MARDPLVLCVPGSRDCLDGVFGGLGGWAKPPLAVVAGPAVRGDEGRCGAELIGPVSRGSEILCVAVGRDGLGVSVVRMGDNCLGEGPSPEDPLCRSDGLVASLVNVVFARVEACVP